MDQTHNLSLMGERSTTAVHFKPNLPIARNLGHLLESGASVAPDDDVSVFVSTNQVLVAARKVTDSYTVSLTNTFTKISWLLIETLKSYLYYSTVFSRGCSINPDVNLWAVHF